MDTKITIEVDSQHEAIVRRALAFAQEMEHLALTTPDGEVFAVCEGAVIQQGRKLQCAVLGAAVAQRIAAAEKKGRRSAPVTADAPRKTAGRRNAVC